jgi:FMN-dependent oxidoreductase (nitrilotriacetate monooxygenase family)
MHLNLFLTGEGHHEAAWRHPISDPLDAASVRHYIWQATVAEGAAFESVFIADALSVFIDIQHSPPRDFEPITLLTAIAMATSRIGLIGTMSTTFTEPYNLARLFASLDHISRGRAGWNIFTTAEDRSAVNYGMEHLPGHAERYARATEFVYVAKKLWDSKEYGYVVADKNSGKYADARKIHQINHSGQFFSVQGPLNIARPPQGHPLLVQAGSSPDGRDFAARFAEVVFTVQHDLESARGFYRDLKERAARHGRDPALLKVLPGVVPIIGDTESNAVRRARELDELIVPARALVALSERLGIDLGAFPLDEPLPELAPAELFPGQQGRYQVIRRMAQEDGLSLRQVILKLAPGRGHRSIVGSAEQVANGLEEWFAGGGADGFTVMPALLPADLSAFTDEVIPILERRGLRRGAYSGETLREHYGQPFPASAI